MARVGNGENVGTGGVEAKEVGKVTLVEANPLNREVVTSEFSAEETALPFEIVVGLAVAISVHAYVVMFDEEPTNSQTMVGQAESGTTRKELVVIIVAY